jgi:glycosyltransferase involved in cell wall biosynthesis
MPDIKSSLIIATYNWKEALELVLISLFKQRLKPFEVIIADDGSRADTKELIDEYRQKFDFPLIHVWHEDKGFRLSEIRNKAIKKSTGNYIIQIDGDTILHKDFIKDHVKNAKKGQFISGSRVLLCKEFSDKLLTLKDFKINLFSKNIKNNHYHLHLPLLSRFLRKPSKEIQEVIHSVRGCNMSFWRQDLISINGYNEDMVGWGREDSELSARLVNLGLTKINLKFNAIQYHIYHPESSKSNLSSNDAILAETISTKRKYVENGIFKKPFEEKKLLGLTAIIPTYNEAENISEIIDNLSFADEILVIDSYSSDQTVEIAKQKNVQVIMRKFDDFSSQKNYAIHQAKNDWIFILDADERISPELKEEIFQKIYAKNKIQGYWIPRINYFMNKQVHFSGWQNDKVLRLFNRNSCEYNGKLVHEEVNCIGKVSSLKNAIIHYTYKSFEDYKKKIDAYSSLKAEELFRKKVKPNPFHCFIKPAYRFVYHYIITFGVLDGKAGYTIAKLNAYGMRQRYLKLKQMNKESKKPNQKE